MVTVVGRRILPLVLLFGAGLAACGGGGTTPAPHPTASAVRGTVATTTVSINVKFTTTASRSRKPRYVGKGTQTITVAVNGGSPAPFACAAPTCTANVTAPLGADTFAVNAYDGPVVPSPAPKLISAGTSSATITQNAANSVNVLLGAIIGSGTLSLTSTNRFPLISGTSTPMTVTIVPTSLVDPDGFSIGSSDVLAPVTVLPSPASTHVTITPATITSPTTPITVTYDGVGTVPIALVAQQPSTGNPVSALPLQIVPHTYFVFVPSYKAGCPNTSVDCLKIWSPNLSAVVGSVAVGNGASDVTVNAGLTQAFVPNRTDGTISVIDISNKELPAVTSTISGLVAPNGIAYDTTHGRNLLYTGSSIASPSPSAHLVSVAATGGTPTLFNPYPYLGGVTLDPTGNCLYSSVYGQNQSGIGDSTGFDTYDLVAGGDRGFTSNFATGNVISAPDGSAVYTITVASGTPAIITKFPVSNPGCSVSAGSMASPAPGVINGSGMVLSRDGTKLYVGGKGGNPALTALTTSPLNVISDYNITGGPALYTLAISPNGRYLYGTDNYGGTATAQFRIIDLLAGGGPAELTGSPFFTNANSVRTFP